MQKGNLCHRKQFIKTFNSIANHRHRYEVFRDFVTMAAISLHNAINKVDTLEQEYLQIVGRYQREEVNNFCELLAHVVEILEPEPRDVLGGLYMELELGNDNTGQFFTPPDVSLMVAQMTYGDQLKNMERPYITLSEPASGAGGMVLAFAKVMMSHGHNPAHKLWVQCIDVDRLAALMCYIQLKLWHIPAEVVVGNTLSIEIREVFYTPAHYLGGWTQRLKVRELSELMNQPPKADKPEPEPKKVQEAPKGDGFQFDFGFWAPQNSPVIRGVFLRANFVEHRMLHQFQLLINPEFSYIFS